MLALYRSSRQAEALQVYRVAQRELAEQLALEPSEELKELERAIRPDTALVTVMWANNETGVLFPIHEIADRWIGKYERGRLRILAELKKSLEGETDG